MAKNMNVKFLFIAKRIVGLLLIIGVAIGFSNKGDEHASMHDLTLCKKSETFVSKLDKPQMIDLLLLETKGDTVLLAKLLMALIISVKTLLSSESQSKVLIREYVLKI